MMSLAKVTSVAAMVENNPANYFTCKIILQILCIHLS